MPGAISLRLRNRPLLVLDNSKSVTLEVKSKRLLDDVHQRIGEQQEDSIDGGIGVHAAVDVEHLIVLHQLEGHIYHAAGTDGNQEGCDEYLRALGQFTQAVNGNQTGNQLHDDEFILIFHCCRTDENHRDMGDESRSGIHKDAHKDRRHGKWDDIYAEEIVLHDE